MQGNGSYLNSHLFQSVPGNLIMVMRGLTHALNGYRYKPFELTNKGDKCFTAPELNLLAIQ